MYASKSMEGTSCSSAGEHTVVINTLSTRGWCFRDVDDLTNLVFEISSTIGGGDQTRAITNSVEADLLNTDIRLIGGKSLPDPIELRRCSYIQGPKVLQISSVRDVTKSSAEEFLGSSSGKRVLKLGLTDGYTEISAVEYSHIPSINNDVAPGTKIRLENKAVIRDGLVCLTPKEVTVLGGYVQTLSEEWQMKKKFSSLSRSGGRQLQENKAGDGPPPFEELHIQTGSRNVVRFPAAEKVADKNLQRNVVDSDLKISVKGENEEKASSSDTRPKQVVEAVPLQNQAAAQVLLQKMKDSSLNEGYQGRRGRGRGRGRGRRRHEDEEESAVFTMDEWEKRNSGGVLAASDDTRRDEDLAWQLQKQFDMEDCNGSGVGDIRMNMFDYGRTDDNMGGGRRGRGRGRGHGRGRGRR